MIIIINIIYNCRSLIVTCRRGARGGRGRERERERERKARRKRKEMSFPVAIYEIFASAETLFTNRIIDASRQKSENEYRYSDDRRG